jgi:hypothetical protein
VKFPTPRCPETGKRAWVDEESATEALERAWRSKHWENRHGRMPKRVYRCPSCGWWHFSSTSKSKAEVARERASA